MTERTRFARRSGLSALAAGLLIACALLIPGPARAQDMECHSTTGGNNVTFQLPPVVNFPLSKIPPVGTVIYQSRPYPMDYLCNYPAVLDPLRRQPVISALGDFGPLRYALSASGLKLEIIVNGDQSHPWTPDMYDSDFVEFFPVGSLFGTTVSTGLQLPKQATFTIQLKVASRSVDPGRYPVPPTTVFKLLPKRGATTSPGIFITTTPTRLQYIPDSCISDVNVDNLVQFGRVLATTAGYMGTLPQQRPFNVTARINPSCPTGNLTIVRPGEGPDQEFYLPLTVTFTTLGTERLSSDGSFIFLRNGDGQENGLQIQITDPVGQPVILNQAVIPSKGNFGLLHGSTLSLRNTYTAQLSPTGSANDMKLGKFATQIMVNVRFE